MGTGLETWARAGAAGCQGLLAVGSGPGVGSPIYSPEVWKGAGPGANLSLPESPSAKRDLVRGCGGRRGGSDFSQLFTFSWEVRGKGTKLSVAILRTFFQGSSGGGGLALMETKYLVREL